MRSGFARRRDVPLIADVAIALALVCSVTFFIIVMEYRVGQGELTRAELRLLAEETRVAHASTKPDNNNDRQRETKESKNGQWRSHPAN
jgi:hypothetical protein